MVVRTPRDQLQGLVALAHRPLASSDGFGLYPAVAGGAGTKLMPNPASHGTRATHRSDKRRTRRKSPFQNRLHN
jgi:hypothetical protein